MRTGRLVVPVAVMLAFASSAVAQDPEEGDFAEPGDEYGELGGDEFGGDESADAELGTEEGGEEFSSEEDSGGGLGDGPEKPISVGLLLGYGISLEDGANPWGLGFGVRGGYNLGPIFLGGRFVYYLGESESAGGAEASFNIWEFGIEGGYDLAVGPVVIRPQLGLGLANVSVSSEVLGMSVSASETELYVAPGGSVLFDVTDSIFVGGEARLQLVLAEETVKAFILMANGGMRF